MMHADETSISETEQKAILEMDKMARKLAIAFHRRCPALQELDDLLQVARMGLLEGVRTYDPSRNVKLSTHAYNCARFALQKAVRTDTGLIKTPSRGTTRDNLPAVTEMPEKWDETCFAEKIQDLDETERRLVLERLMDGLGEKQKRVIALIFFQNLTYEEAAHQLGITKQTVHYLSTQALAKMRATATREDIKYFDF